MRTLLVLAKAPRAGLSKTRLARAQGIGAETAGRLAEAFLRDTLESCARVEGAELVLQYAPAAERAYFAQLAQLAPAARLVAQVEGDLGARVRAAFDEAFARGATRALAIGTDTPQLDSELLGRAFDALERCDVVLGPSADGGYYLIGLRRPAEALFQGIDWSTPRVRAQTLERARAAGLSLLELPLLQDVDELEDLRALARQLALAPATTAPRTRALLRELDFFGAD